MTRISDNIASIYLNSSYAEHNPQFGDDTAAWKAKNIQKMFQRCNQKLDLIAELGCGGGGVLLELQKLMPKIKELHGYEPMPEAFAVCKTRENQSLKFFSQTLTSDSQVPHYDALIMADVFEHIEDYLGFLRGCNTMADTFYFHIPLDMSVQMVARMNPFQILRDKVGHLHYFSKETALESLKHAGYEVLDWFYTSGADSGCGTLRYRMMKWPRKFFYALTPDLAVRFLGGYSLMVAAKKAITPI